MKSVFRRGLYVIIAASMVACGGAPEETSLERVEAAPFELISRALAPHLLETACNFGQSNYLHPYGDIGATWNALGGTNSPLGCPVSPEMNAAEGSGRIQTFEFGQISWSAPRNGEHPILVAYQAGNAIEVIWAGTQPFNYDFWIVRTDENGVNIDQPDPPTRGKPCFLNPSCIADALKDAAAVAGPIIGVLGAL